jgi:hypothetical protein
MTTEQRGTPSHVSAATVHQALVARGLTMRDMVDGQSVTGHYTEYCGFLFREYESALGQCGSQWTDYMVQWLPRHLESAVAAASNVPDSELDVSRAGDDEETARLPPDPRQGDFYV